MSDHGVPTEGPGSGDISGPGSGRVGNIGTGAGRKRVRDSTNGVAALSPPSMASGGTDIMRDDADGDPYDVDMDTQAALDHAERDGDIAGVAAHAVLWPVSQASAPALGSSIGVPFYPLLGSADLDVDNLD